jgi:hypothetical protein
VLLLDNSIKYLIQHGSETLEESVNDKAHWTVSAALSTALVSMTIAVLLNQSLDGPGTLLINNRYIRLVPRILLIVMVMCLPITGIKTPWFFFFIMGLMVLVGLWEHVASLDKGCRLFEPKEAAD